LEKRSSGTPEEQLRELLVSYSKGARELPLGDLRGAPRDLPGEFLAEDLIMAAQKLLRCSN